MRGICSCFLTHRRGTKTYIVHSRPCAHRRYTQHTSAFNDIAFLKILAKVVIVSITISVIMERKHYHKITTLTNTIGFTRRNAFGFV